MSGALVTHCEGRISELQGFRASGGKVVGYFPGSYVPEELIYAAGAVPICLADGGDAMPMDASASVIPRNFCAFVRAQVGEKLLRRNPYYGVMDGFVAPVACQHLKKVAEIWEYDADLKIVKLGVPLANTGAPDLEYYAAQLEKLKLWLEELTGNAIDDEKLWEAISVYNGLRRGLRKISSLRRSHDVRIGSSEFLRLNHASFYADPVVMMGALESTYGELVGNRGRATMEGPRLLLIGPNVGSGDYKVMDLVDAAGGSIVVELVDEGVRNYWKDIETQGDPIEALARGYLRDRVPCAFMIESAKCRLDFALNLIADFAAEGAIWYELLGCETYDSESYWFARELERRSVPCLVLESDYGMSESGSLKTRIDAFIEMVKGV